MASESTTVVLLVDCGSRSLSLCYCAPLTHVIMTLHKDDLIDWFKIIIQLACTLYRAFADRRAYLIMSLSRSRTSPTLSLHYCTLNNTMHAVKILYTRVCAYRYALLYRDLNICIAVLWSVTADWKVPTVWSTVVGSLSCLTGVSAACIHQYMKLMRRPTAVSQRLRLSSTSIFSFSLLLPRFLLLVKHQFSLSWQLGANF